MYLSGFTARSFTLCINIMHVWSLQQTDEKCTTVPVVQPFQKREHATTRRRIINHNLHRVILLYVWVKKICLFHDGKSKRTRVRCTVGKQRSFVSIIRHGVDCWAVRRGREHVECSSSFDRERCRELIGGSRHKGSRFSVDPFDRDLVNL